MIVKILIFPIVPLAPMAGVTNSAFRTILQKSSERDVVMEMVSDKGIQYYNSKKLLICFISMRANPVSIQLFGSDEVTA